MAIDIAREAFTVALPGAAEVTVCLSLPPAQPRATLVCLPALGVPASYYEVLVQALAQRGIAAVSADLRGLGLSSVRPKRGVDFGYAQLVEDAAVIVAAVRRRLPGPVVVLGHSLGGHVAALLAGSAPASADGLVLCACGTPYWRRFPPGYALGIRLLAHVAVVSGNMLGYFPGRYFGFGGTEAAQLMREWSRLARSGKLQVAGLDAEGAFARVGARTLVISLEGDRMAPKAAVDHLVGKLTSARIEHVHLSRDAADPRALDHFRWAKLPLDVVDRIERWLGAQD